MMALSPVISQNDSVDLHVQTRKFIQDVDVDFKRVTSSPSGIQTTQKMGRAILQIINLDSHPTSLYEYIESIYDYPAEKQKLLTFLYTALQMITSEEFVVTGPVAVLHHFELFPSFRKKQLSQSFIALLQQAMKQHTNVSMILLQAFPMEKDLGVKEEVHGEILRLEKLYSSAGFKMVINRKLSVSNGLEVHYMYKYL